MTFMQRSASQASLGIAGGWRLHDQVNIIHLDQVFQGWERRSESSR
jgi:hypothetical protein